MLIGEYTNEGYRLLLPFSASKLARFKMSVIPLHRLINLLIECFGHAVAYIHHWFTRFLSRLVIPLDHNVFTFVINPIQADGKVH